MGIAFIQACNIEVVMKILRLLLNADCNRNCVGCCNKQWNLNYLPVADSRDFNKFDMIILTGGEPMLYPQWVRYMAQKIRSISKAKIILYTAKLDFSIETALTLLFIDGITLTLHTQKDVEIFKDLQKNVDVLNGVQVDNIFKGLLLNKSKRLNVFKNVNIENIDTSGWTVKKDIEWIEDCPLPKDEVFMRY